MGRALAAAIVAGGARPPRSSVSLSPLLSEARGHLQLVNGGRPRTSRQLEACAPRTCRPERLSPGRRFGS
eukprot:12328068-Alexandrium_andersonii.AAC.1